MKIIVTGGTGTVGSAVVPAARQRGHEVIGVSRRTGVDVSQGSGLDDALIGADAVIDVTSVPTLSKSTSIRFFRSAASNVLAAAQRANLAHVVRLSIIGVDRNPHGFYAGQLEMERVYEASAAPTTILRAAQFHEFAAQTLQRASLGPLAIAPRAPVQPVAGSEVAQRLVEIAEGAAVGRAADLAGPQQEDLADMVKRYAQRTGRSGRILSAQLPGAMMRGMAKGLNTPDDGAQLGSQTFAEWLAEQ